MHRAKILFLLVIVCGCNHQPRLDYPITPVPFTQVQLTDEFWAPRIQTNRSVTIPHAFKKYDELGLINNFALAGGMGSGEQGGNYPFDDTDIYKTIEGVAYELNTMPDVELEGKLDRLIGAIGAAQEEDGYLYTARTNRADRFLDWMGESRWSNLGRSHELYNAGHLYEAAVAHYQATGKRTLLDVAVRNADLVAAEFGTNKRRNPPGHQEIEIGLVKLYRITGQKKYLSLAKFFMDERGVSHQGRELLGEYAQDHKPAADQAEAVGHAVRAGYMYSGMADIVALTGAQQYQDALNRLWKNVVGKKLHVTGGIGSVGMGESFGANYELPNMTAYNETCSSIANVFWNHRMFLLGGDAKYLDVLEMTLCNALLSGISMQGNLFFYDNPLASRGQHQRSPWLYCACCISNLTRFFPTIPGYVYARTDESIFINMFARNKAWVTIKGKKVHLSQDTRYPWDGKIQIKLSPEEPIDLTIHIRIPGWARNEAIPGDLYRFQNPSQERIAVAVNGEQIETHVTNGFLQIKRSWDQDDQIDLDLPMPVRRVVANEKVLENANKVALKRGPLVYCAEGIDQEDRTSLNLVLPDEAELESAFREDLLNGVVVLQAKAFGTRFADDRGTIEQQKQNFLAIPYYAWAHRGNSEMAVWIATDVSAAKPQFGPTIASTSKPTSSGGKNLAALNDGRYPRKSSDIATGAFLWSPGRDTVWVQYNFRQPEEVSEVQVYWLDDGKRELAVPKSWRLLANHKGEWRVVWNYSRHWAVEKDTLNKVIFETVKTTSVRLEAQLQPNLNGGIFEWGVF